LASLAGASPTAVSSVLNGTWQKRRISASLAEKIVRIADEQGYALNMQASGLRREKSNLIGMIVPKYDNRYFGSIVERFEAMARDRGLFPIITCTQRDADLEIQAAREMISHQVDCIVATGATDPDRITELCMNSRVRSLNLDLPGRLAPSVISDNRGGARALARRILQASMSERKPGEALLYIGGRPTDHNTAERIQGFRDAHAELGLNVDEGSILARGYSPDKAEKALGDYAACHQHMPTALFVSSTITLEGVVRWIKTSGRYGGRRPHIGCFDWDPLGSILDENIVMLRQDVPRMLDELFRLIAEKPAVASLIEIPTILEQRPTV
jgi:LacI family transcriptional regulator, fructose operon transcriptional repressor